MGGGSVVAWVKVLGNDTACQGRIEGKERDSAWREGRVGRYVPLEEEGTKLEKLCVCCCRCHEQQLLQQ